MSSDTIEAEIPVRFRALKHGDKVRCLRGSIDRGRGAGQVGYITGFATLSPYHPREVYISNIDGDSSAPWCGWFWERDLECAP